MGKNGTANDFSTIVKKIQLAAFANLNMLATYWYVLCSKQRCKQTVPCFQRQTEHQIEYGVYNLAPKKTIWLRPKYNRVNTIRIAITHRLTSENKNPVTAACYLLRCFLFCTKNLNNTEST
jgi:hypothetical protein